MHDLTKNNTKLGKIEWSNKCQEAFDTLKNALCSSVTLNYVDFDKPFYIKIDASGAGLGAVISQKVDKTLKPIAFASRKLRNNEVSQRDYSSKQLEFLGLKWAITEKFRDYLYHQKAIIITDNNPLSYLKTAKSLSAKDLRWASQLQQFQFEIQHRSGKMNAAADALSRMDAYDSENEDSDTEEVNCNTFSQNVMTQEMEIVTSDELRKLQRNDPVIQEFLYFQNKNLNPTERKNLKPRVKVMLRKKEKFEFKNGILFRKVMLPQKGDTFQLVVPESLSTKVLNLFHDRFGHQGENRTYALLHEKYYWVGMKADVSNYVKKCDRCVHAKSPSRKFITPMQFVEASRPLEVLAIDFTLLDKASNGIENVLVMTDVYTKFAVAVPTRNQTAETTAKVLVKEWFQKYGVPLKIHSDQGRNFESDLIKKLCKIYNIKKDHTCPCTPRGNGQCKRFNRTLHELLRTLEEKKKRKWTEYIADVTFMYNATPHKSHGFSPFYLLFGRDPRLPNHNVLQVESNEEEERSIDDYLEDHCERLESAYEIANNRLKKDRIARKKNYDRKARELPLRLGDRIYLRKHYQGRSKIKDYFGDDIYKIVKTYHEKNIYGVTLADDSTDVVKTVNRSEMIQCPREISADEEDDEREMHENERREIDVDNRSERSDESVDSEYDLLIEQQSLNRPSDSESNESEVAEDSMDEVTDEEVVVETRRSARTNKGQHSNPHNMPRSVLNNHSMNSDFFADVLYKLCNRNFRK